MPAPPITRVVLYKHGIGYFEREGSVQGAEALGLTFRKAEVSDVLKSLVILDLDGGHISSVSYDSTKPLEQLLAEVALKVPEQESLLGFLPQIQGARVALEPAGGASIEGVLLGFDTVQQNVEGTVSWTHLVALLGDDGRVRQFDLHDLGALRLLEESVRRDLDHYLRTRLAAKKKDARQFTIFAQGEGSRRLRIGYTVEAPVWKATYRMVLPAPGTPDPPMLQGWAIVDNTHDEDWNNVALSLVAGLPVSFVHDLDSPRYIRRPVVAVRETTGLLPPTVEEGFEELISAPRATLEVTAEDNWIATGASARSPKALSASYAAVARGGGMARDSAAAPAVSSTPTQVREREVGDLFEYAIEHPVTILRNQAALVPILLKPFGGRAVLLYNKANRAQNPMRCVDFANTTGLTLEGGPVTVLEGGDYVGEAMLPTLKPAETRLVPYAVELAVSVTDRIDTREDVVRRVVIRRGTMQLASSRVRITTYTLKSRAEAEALVYLEHPRESGSWALDEATPAPHETTENFWRFRFPLPPRGQTRFLVQERQPTQKTHTLGTSLDQVGAWISQRYFDEATGAALKRAQEIAGRLAAVEQEIRRLEARREAIVQAQDRLRENLKALGERPSEKELRERYVRTLGEQEDQFEDLNRALDAETATREVTRAQLDASLMALEYDVKLEKTAKSDEKP